jgi:hypothetical protein
MKKNATKTITTEELDRKFDAGEDISEYVDWSKATRPGLKLVRINVDFPQHIVQRLDEEAALRGIARQALIKTIVFEAVAETSRPDTVRENLLKLRDQLLHPGRAPAKDQVSG